MEPDLWNNLYLTLFKGMTKKGIFDNIEPDSKIRLYNAIGLCLSYSGRNTEAVKWFLKLRHYSLICKNNWGIGQSYINWGLLIINLQIMRKPKLAIYKQLN